MKWYFTNILIAMSQFTNAVLAGYPDEMLSARCYREKRWFRHVLDWVFYWDKDENGNRNHCQQCYWHEMNGRDLPEEYR